MKVDSKWAYEQIEFEGCFSLNPKTFESTGLNQIFYVSADGEIWPNPITKGKYRNCSQEPSGEPVDHHAKIIAILSKYTDKPEEAYYKLMVEPFQF